MPNANIATRSAKPTRKMLISTPEFIADSNARLRVFLIFQAITVPSHTNRDEIPRPQQQ